MVVYPELDPAIYGPVNGQYVTLSVLQAYLAAEAARNQVPAGPTVTQPPASLIPNPYVTPAAPAAPAAPQPTTNPQGDYPYSGGFYGGGSGDTYCDFYPYDPLCGYWGGGFGGNGGASGPGVIYENITVIQQGLAGTDVANMIDGALRGAWAAEVSAVDGVIVTLVREIQTALTGLGNAIKAGYTIVARLAGFILQALATVLKELLRGMLKVLEDIREVLKHIYDDVLKPLAAAMAKLRQRLMDIYERFIRPVLIVIQDIRKVLRLLAAFHVPFAAKLDRTLADLEKRITGPFLLLLRYTNAVANWVNLIITNGYLLQRSVFLNSIKHYVGSIGRLLFASVNRPPAPADVAAGMRQLEAPSPHQTQADTQEFLEHGSGPFVAPLADTTELFKTLLANGLPR
jgi:hypothetical protein